MKALVVVPTYNERENLPRLLERIGSVRDGHDLEVVFVDDNSPDGTGALADEFAEQNPWVHVIHRPGKSGLGTAYVEGFKYGLAQGFDLLLEMDADLSHDPAAIPDLLQAATRADLVLGSRYVRGGGVENWGVTRQIISRGGSLYARLALGVPVRDLTGGFKCFHREVLESLNLDGIQSNGYCFQIEMTYRAYQKGFTVVEVPIRFRDREAGTSKMSHHIVLEAMWKVLKLRRERGNGRVRETTASQTPTVEKVLSVEPSPSMLSPRPALSWADELRCSVGVMAHNEEATVGKVLDGILKQQLDMVRVNEIFVVASGCTDGTVEAVQQFRDRDDRVKLLVQERREGKASAVNLFLRNASEDIAVVMGGDTIPAATMIERLVSPMADPSVGMTGAHPIPLNDSRTFFGYAAHLLWGLHHELALQSPKLGESIAFRKLFTLIPVDTPVDELSIEALITGMGFRLQYAGDSIIYNRGPDNFRDFLKQRRRIYCGHLQIKAGQRYAASTMDTGRILSLWLGRLGPGPKDVAWACSVAAIEAFSRLLGAYDFRRKKQHHVWTVVSSTKHVTKGLREGRSVDNKDSLVALHFRNYDGLVARLGRRQMHQAVGKLAGFLASDLREGRLVRAIPAKGLIVLTADVERDEIEDALARASASVRLGNGLTGQKKMPVIGPSDMVYTMFSLNDDVPMGMFVPRDLHPEAGHSADEMAKM